LCRSGGVPPKVGVSGEKVLAEGVACPISGAAHGLIVVIAAPCNGPLTSSLTIGCAVPITLISTFTSSLTMTLTTLSDLSEKGLPDR